MLSTTTSEVSFASGGQRIAATLHEPQSGSGARTCVVMGHGFTLTRKDGIPAYAQRFATAGFAALAFDYRHWGDSDGYPRRWISLDTQLADWKAAVEYARSIENVDADRIVVWGMSMGGGHAVLTASADPRIAAVVGLLPTMDQLVSYPRSMVGARMLAYALAEKASGRPFRLAAAGPAGAFAVATAPEASSGFAEVTAGTGWQNEVNSSWLLSALRWHPVRHAARVHAPMLLQLGEFDRAISGAAIEEAARLAPRAVLERYEVDHFGCFKPDQVGRMASDQIDFLKRCL